MTTLLFLITLLSLIVLVIILIIKYFGRKPIKTTLKTIGIVLAGYLVLWITFKSLSKMVPVPLCTDVCFDDWCATVTGIDSGAAIQTEFSSINADNKWLVLHIRTSNHTRGIAQKPSEPRVSIRDSEGDSWGYSIKGMQLLEKVSGKQAGIDKKLELHESSETILVYNIPKNRNGLKALIEEGPFITRLLLPGNKEVFTIE